MQISSGAVQALLTIGVALCFSSFPGASAIVEDTEEPTMVLTASPFAMSNFSGGGGIRNNLYEVVETDAPSVVVVVVVPTAAPKGVLPSTPDSGVNGDPHFKTWSGHKYDYHGLCDLVLLRNPDFARGLGMEIHIRSKKTKNWSYISTASLRIGSEVFEVSGEHDGNHHYLNGNSDIMGFAHVDLTSKGESGHSSLNGYPMTLQVWNAYQRTYTVELRNAAEGGGEIGTAITFKTWKHFVRVDITNPTDTLFHGSTGLMGSYPSGDTVGRDGHTMIHDIQQFGQEWQVTAEEPKIFHVLHDGPQQPASKCVAPSAEGMRRGLAEAIISRSEAEAACGRPKGNHHNYREDEFDLCVFDLMATGDRSIVSDIA